MTNSSLLACTYRQGRGLCAVEDAADIDARLAMRLRLARCVADQPADFGLGTRRTKLVDPLRAPEAS